MAEEHSKDKRQMAAWVERQLAEKVDSVASKRGITRTAAIIEALQRYVEEETSTAKQLEALDLKLDEVLGQRADQPPADNTTSLDSEEMTLLQSKLDELLEVSEKILDDVTRIKTGKARKTAPKKKPDEQATLSLF